MLGDNGASGGLLGGDGMVAKRHLRQRGPVGLCLYHVSACGDLRAIRRWDRRAQRAATGMPALPWPRPESSSFRVTADQVPFLTKCRRVDLLEKSCRARRSRADVEK